MIVFTRSRAARRGLRELSHSTGRQPKVVRNPGRALYRVLAALLVLGGLSACTPETTSGVRMAEANRLYETGQFVEAAAAYEALADAGVADGALYYNLGNAYFKSGDLGRAILSYRRAQELLPRDPDVAANLRLARAQAIDRLEPENQGVVVGFVRRVLTRWTTLNEAAGIVLGLWTLLCALVVAAILWRRGWLGLRYAIAAVSVMLALSLLSIAMRVSDVHGSSPAVVVVEVVEAHSGPGKDYLTEFTLHAGAEIRVLERRDDWVRIVLPGDLQGWVPDVAVESL